jgi:hypothetical protein
MGSMGASPSTFRIANHTLVCCEDGPLEVEATLFAATLGGVRPTTSAREARARLAWLGLTPAFARQALEALDREALGSYSRARCVGTVLPTLTPSEVFAGRAYDFRSQTYEGVWFDVRALATDLHVPNAGFVLQGLYLASMLDELAPATPITLENGGSGEAARAAFLRPHSVVGALSRLGPRAQRTPRGEDLARVELGRLLRDQSAMAVAAARSRHLTIEQALAEIDKPERGRLADTELWTIERQLADNDARGALERIQSYVGSHGGETRATRYLRAHLALVEGSESPQRVAEALLDEGRSGPPFYELDLLKARAWMAAGAWTYARHFARGLLENPNVSDEVALAAHEIVETVNSRGVASGDAPTAIQAPDEPPPSTERVPPPSIAIPSSHSTHDDAVARASVLGTPIYVVAGAPSEPAPSFREPAISPGEPAPSSLEVFVEFAEPVSEVPRVVGPEAPGVIFASLVPPESRIPIDRGLETDRPPPIHAMVRPIKPALRRFAYAPEEVESLSLPPGLSEEQLAEGVAARNTDEVRIVSTRFARALAREYRERYSVQLRTDPQAIEGMQRHLMNRWGATGLNGPEAIWDVRRHGALLSEILARTLDAEWVDVAPTEVGYWAMFVPPRTRTWPFGRVHRFLTLGHREKDLVSYFLDLAARAHGG